MVLIDGTEYLTEEEKRLKEDRERTKYWKKWGSYVSERQWATGIQRPWHISTSIAYSFPVREDYSADGDAWSRKLTCEINLDSNIPLILICRLLP